MRQTASHAGVLDVGDRHEIDPLATIPGPALREISAAAWTILDIRRLLAKTGDNVVGEVLRGEGMFTEWNHYPNADVYDPETHSQYYYHAHPAQDAKLTEHGHFHLFLGERGMPDGVRPTPGQSLPPDNNRELCHLIAISMDAVGQPIRLFTTNRWVTGDLWYPAEDVSRMVPAFRVDVVRPNLAVNRWISAIVQLFRPQIDELLRDRDEAIEAWRKHHPKTDAFEDRRLEITSMMEISADSQIDAVLSRLDGGSDGSASP